MKNEQLTRFENEIELRRMVLKHKRVNAYLDLVGAAVELAALDQIEGSVRAFGGYATIPENIDLGTISTAALLRF